MEHFGLKLIKRKYSFKLNREEFAPISTKPSNPFFPALEEKGAYTDSSGAEYRLEWCQEYRKLCLVNYDLNMKYFSLLDRESFERELEAFIERHSGFVPVDNLRQYEGVAGYYIMVLDEYKQVYIGKSGDITKRIRQHWTSTKPLDRTLCPMYAEKESCFSIDFFRALDTTRIYVWEQRLVDGIESELVADFPKMYCTNRIGGDVSTSIEAVSTMNARRLGD